MTASLAFATDLALRRRTAARRRAVAAGTTVWLGVEVDGEIARLQGAPTAVGAGA